MDSTEPRTFSATDEERRGQVTQLLKRADHGDRAATDDLFPIVYEELRRIAGRMLGAERPSHTLQATALVHEAYLRLVDPAGIGWESRGHFFGAAATAIRRILVDHARSRGRLKRGGGWERVTLGRAEIASMPPEEFLALDEALARLAAMDPRMARIVELRFLIGLTIPETAGALGISEATAVRDWQLARVWLHAQLADEAAGGT